MMLVGVVLALAAGVSTPTARTDFGIREIGFVRAGGPAPSLAVRPSPGAHPVDISAIAALGSAWGKVTSTYRSPERNRRVGGVRNSFHLSGRAIDIVRRPGVSHSAIAAAYRNAGYHLAESLDEGDHSHFAFGSPRGRREIVSPPRGSSGMSASGTQWRIVAAPR
jgi:hypothetical protein